MGLIVDVIVVILVLVGLACDSLTCAEEKGEKEALPLFLLFLLLFSYKNFTLRLVDHEESSHLYLGID